MKVIILILLSFSISSFGLYAQDSEKTSIKGRVVDNLTGEQLISATVFLENTTFGTVTDLKGEFLITNIPHGSYYLVVSSIGHEMQRIPLRTEKDTLQVNLRLKQKSIILAEVNVVAQKDDDWDDYMEVFEREFLGTTKNSRLAKILNPEVISFKKDEESKVLTASTDSTIVVENKALGYKLFIFLESFSYDQKRGVNFLTRIRFQELPWRNDDEKETWKINRKDVYTGSQKHFFNSLLRKVLHQEGFRLSQGPLYLLTSGMGVYLTEEEVDLQEDLNDLLRMDLNTCFRIDCQKNSTTDYIVPNTRFILLDREGNRMDGGVMNVGGHWAEQRISEALPHNYIPGE